MVVSDTSHIVSYLDKDWYHAHDIGPGFNLVCVMAFKTNEDLVYFMKQEPSHQELKALVAGKLAKDVMVVDFVDSDATTVFNS